MSAERPPISVGLLALGAVGVAVLRLALTLADPDLVHPVDPAELAHLQVLPALLDGRLGWLLGADANVHHGGFFWLGLAVGGLRHLVGSDLGAVRGLAALVAGASWAVWVALAHRLGGRFAAVGLGLVLAVPSPWMAQWSATLWGSHTEAALWTGAWGLALTHRGRPACLGVLLGVGAAWDPLLWPTAGLTLALAPQRARVLAALGPAWLLVRLPTVWADPLGMWTTSLSEHPDHTALGVLAQAADLDRLAATVGSHLPLPWTSTVGAGGAQWGLDLGLTLLVGGAGAALIASRGRGERGAKTTTSTVVWWLVSAPWLHLAVVLLAAPTRPALAHRYLVAWWPAWLLVPWLLPGRARVAAVGPVVASVLAVPLLGAALGRVDLDTVGTYPAAAFQGLGLDRVPVHRAPGVRAFLSARAPAETAGFAAAFSPRWGYPVWGEPFPAQVRAPGLAERLASARTQAELAPARVDANLGFGLWVACDHDPECVATGLQSLALAEVDVAWVASGAEEARGVLGECPSRGAVVPDPPTPGRGWGCP